jgi:hypothetical protein
MYVVVQDWCLSVLGNNEHFYDVSLISRFQSLWSLNAMSDCFHLKAARPEKPPGVPPFPVLQGGFPIMSTTTLVNVATVLECIVTMITLNLMLWSTAHNL